MSSQVCNVVEDLAVELLAVELVWKTASCCMRYSLTRRYLEEVNERDECLSWFRRIHRRRLLISLSPGNDILLASISRQLLLPVFGVIALKHLHRAF